MQYLVNKIKNNISISVNNLVLKYIDGDTVLSLSCKSIENWSADLDWKRGFFDYLGSHLLLHRVFEVNELTICLDQRNAEGKIEVYQGLILFEFSGLLGEEETDSRFPSPWSR